MALKPFKPLKPLQPLVKRRKSPIYKARYGGSAFIQGHEYDPDKRELSITFKNGKSFAYSDVPAHISTGLRDAPSKGQYFHGKIRGNFNHREK